MATEWKAHYRIGGFSSVVFTKQGYTQLEIFNLFKVIIHVGKAIKCAKLFLVSSSLD